MENPNTWNDIQRLINTTIEQYETDAVNGRIGYSLPSRIYHALKDAGMLNEGIEIKELKVPEKPKAMIADYNEKGELIIKTEKGE